MFFIILFVGLLLRLSFINKPEGLWNDEYVSWFVAQTPFKEGFFQEIIKQCHMPLYYFYLKIFANNSDIILRLSSVLPSFLSILIMYLVGKEFSKKTGLIAASITSILSFLIYYAQEVRFYSLVFLFSTLSLLFTIKLLKENTHFNKIGYILSNLLIILTHHLGIIYVLFNMLYLIYKKKELSKKFIIIFSTMILITIPLGINILKMLPSSQWWGHFTYTNILFLFSDYFSPILTNNINAPTVFFYNKNYIILQTIPTLIAITGLLYGIKNFKGIITIASLTIMSLSILAYSGKIVFITKYSIEILPILILLITIGFTRLKKIGLALFIIFITFHLIAFFTPYYVTKIRRTEGHRIVREILNRRSPDKIIFTYYEPNRFYRYINLKNRNTYYISKINRFDYLENPNLILKDIYKNETISVVFLDSVSFFDDDFIKLNKNNPKIPEMFMTFSIIKNSLIKELNNEYTNYKVDKIGSWTVITATKK